MRFSRKLAFIFSIVWIGLGAMISHAQETEQTSIRSILNKLENRFEIKFNYDPNLIQDLRGKMPSDLTSLEAALEDLKSQFSLDFIVVSQEFVLIKKPDSLVLCGYLRNIDTLMELEGATIQTSQNATVSAANGYFSIEVENINSVISIRYLGYKTISRPYSGFIAGECSDIFLRPFIQTLEEVLISNYLVEGIDKISNGELRLDMKSFKILPGLVDPDVLQAVQAFPGILSINETVSNINIRGGSHDQNLILWDDIKMYQSGHFFGLISMYNPQITQRVSLIKNGTESALTDGVSGTIAMETSKEINSDLNANFGLNMIDANLFADVPIAENSSLQIAARKSISDFFETPTYDRYFERIAQDTELQMNTQDIINSDQTFDFYDTSLRWLYHPSERDQVQLNFINVVNELEFKESSTGANPQSRNSNLSQNSIAVGLNYSRNLNDRLKLIFEAYNTDYKLKAINANVIEQQRFLQENKVSETSLKLRSNYKLNDQININGGYHFTETAVTNLDDVDVPLFRNLVSEVVRAHAGFAELNWRSRQATTFAVLGLRYNFLDKFSKSIFEPRLSLTHQLSGEVSLQLLGEFKHQFTSQVINFQNDFLGIEKRRWQLSNDNDIPVIQSKQISAGIDFDSDGWLLDVTAYYKLVEGITSQSQGFQNQFEFVKTPGDYRVFGVDALIRKEIADFNGWLSYSFMDNTYDFPGLFNAEFPSNFDITHAVSFGLNYSGKNLSLSAGLNWHNGKPVTIPVPGNEIVDDDINFDLPNEERLDYYMRLDFSGKYNFRLSQKLKAEVGVAVWNVLDRENQINNFFRIVDDNLTQSLQRSLGITPNASIRLLFDNR